MKSDAPEYTTPRLIRYVEDGVLPGANLLAIFDPTQNFLVISKRLFALLEHSDQEQVLRTHETSLTVDLNSILCGPFLTLN